MLGKAQLAFLKVRPDSMSLPHLSLTCAVFRLPTDVPWVEQGSIPDHRTTLQCMENPTGRGVIPRWDVQAD